MRRSHFLKKLGRYSLGGLGVAVGLPSGLAACQRLPGQSQTNTSTSSKTNAASPSSPAPLAEAVPADAGVEDPGPWRVAIASSFRLFAMKNKGQLEGFEPDLIQAIGRICDVELTIDSQPFDALLPLMQVGQIEVALGAMPIPASPVEGVAFSQAYFRSGVAIAALPENEQLNHLGALSGKAIAVILGSSGARLPINIPGSRILTYADAQEALQSVADGDADVALLALPLLHQVVKSDGGASARPANKLLQIKQMGALIGAYDIGIMVRSQTGNAVDAARVQKINAALATLRQDGTYEDIYARWWGVPSA